MTTLIIIIIVVAVVLVILIISTIFLILNEIFFAKILWILTFFIFRHDEFIVS
jgi:hypothetical protein